MNTLDRSSRFEPVHHVSHDRSTRSRPRLRALVLFAAAGTSACSGSGGGTEATPQSVPDFAAATFSDPTRIDNAYLPLVPGTTYTIVKQGNEASETIVAEVLDTTRVVNGVTCVVVRDRAFEDGLLLEDTYDWYAQDDDGNVWYMGEETVEYEYDDDGNLLEADTEGSWEAGMDVAGLGSIALPGHVMRAAPMPGDLYHQEYYRGEAEDTGEVIALGVPIELEDGTLTSCLQIRDGSTLGGVDPEDKFYAAGIGLVREENVGGGEAAELRGTFDRTADSIPDFGAATFTNPTVLDNPLFPFEADLALTYLGEAEDERETIVIEVSDASKTVQGVDCLTVRDRVFQDGLLIEDTYDWFAQDDDGNVWYMGEDVTNYEYDDEGDLVGTDDEGSWEAGLDVAGTGSVAQPGHWMRALPATGESYFQEYYPDEAEDMGYVAATGVEVELDDVTFVDCARIVDWNPLEPAGVETKYFAPGLGLVLEEALHEEGTTRLKGVFDRSAASLPDFGGASFSNPTLIDNTHLPYTVGTIFTYESETEDGLETTTVEVLATTRVVAGVTCAIVNDVVTLDGLVLEDTYDWFAQDDDGNVWYMGEDVTNYEYDDDDNLIGTDDDGSWEAGLDVAGTGSPAEPGLVAPASPIARTAYYQEFYEGEAEDMGFVVALGVEVELSDGTVYEDCLQVLDWNPLEPDALEYKYYAPDVGLVLEEALHDDEVVELVSVTP